MASERLLQLPDAANADVTDVIYAVKGSNFLDPTSGTSVQETLQQVCDLAIQLTILHYGDNPNGHVAGTTYQLCYDYVHFIMYVCTHTGNATSAVWTEISSSSPITIPLPMSDGGTGADLVPSNGGIVYSGASAMAILPGTPTADQIVLSGANSAPQWSAATYPFATTANQLLYSSATDTITGLATANSATIYTNASGVPAWTGSMTDGQLLIGYTGGTPTVATLTAGSGVTITNGAGSITIASSGGISIPVSLADGGTGASLVANDGGIVWSASSSMGIIAGTATANQVLLSGSTAAPHWSTATYPVTATSSGTILRADGTNWSASTATFANTYSASTILYSNGAHTVTGLATANSAALVTSSAGVPAWSSTMTNGQVIIGSTGATPTAATLTAGSGVTISNSAGAITISASGGGFSWTHVTGTSQAMAVNNGYVVDNVGLVTLTLPTTSVIGDAIAIMGKGAGGWKITYTTGQYIVIGASTSTVTSGDVASSQQYDSLYLVCIEANLGWSTLGGPQGNLTIV